jgi:hypothetical protein
VHGVLLLLPTLMCLCTVLPHPHLLYRLQIQGVL